MSITNDLPASLQLAAGSHEGARDAFCLLEAVAFVAGEPWSDHPVCVSPVLATFGRNLNDVLPDDLRQRLVPFIPKLIGTAGHPALDERRGCMALDWLVRTYLPAWLRLVPALVPDADALAGMRPVEDLESAAAIGVLVREAATRSAAAWDAAGAAAGAAAWDAAWDAAGAAARDAAWDAAGAAARDAAWAAVRDAAWDAAWDAARDAARAAVRDAARDAVRAALAPTVTALQESAITLYAAMIEVSA